MTQDLFSTSKSQFWQFCQRKKLFNSVDISRYAMENYYLRASRTAREWAEPKEKTGKVPRLRSLNTQEKLRLGLWDGCHQIIAYYRINENYVDKSKNSC